MLQGTLFLQDIVQCNSNCYCVTRYYNALDDPETLRARSEAKAKKYTDAAGDRGDPDALRAAAAARARKYAGEGGMVGMVSSGAVYTS